MENFSELIKNRRSMRKFTDEELTQDEVVALMKAALSLHSSRRVPRPYPHQKERTAKDISSPRILPASCHRPLYSCG